MKSPQNKASVFLQDFAAPTTIKWEKNEQGTFQLGLV